MFQIDFGCPVGVVPMDGRMSDPQLDLWADVEFAPVRCRNKAGKERRLIVECDWRPAVLGGHVYSLI